MSFFSTMAGRVSLPGLLLFLAGTGGVSGQQFAPPYYAAAGNGDLSSAIREIEALDGNPPKYTGEFDRNLIRRVRARFVEQTETWPPATENDFVNDVLEVYRDYWRRSLTGHMEAEEGETFLKTKIRETLVRHGLGKDADDPGEVLGKMSEHIEAAGFYHLGGKTLPFFECMIWRTRDEQDYDIQLTDGKQQVKVIFISDFVVKGWQGFATFGRQHTGGWATRQALYCLGNTYDRDSEKFHSYLVHEARHYADYGIFPNLEQPDLEYRAKLTELAYTRKSTHTTLSRFAAFASDRAGAAPHSKANHAVVAALSKKILDRPFVSQPSAWAEVPVGQVNQAARQLLEEHTRQLESRGAETVPGIIGGTRRD